MMTRLRHLGTVAATVALAASSLTLVGCGDDVTSSTDDLVLSDTLVEDPLDDVTRTADSTAPDTPGGKIEWLAEQLDMTPEQVVAFTAAYEAFRAEIVALHEAVRAGDITRAEAREAAAAAREAFEAEVQVILDEDQYELWQEIRSEHPGHHGPRDPMARWTALLERIGADEAQIASVLGALDAHRDAVADVRRQVADGELTREEARELLMSLRADFHDAVSDILGEELYAALLDLLPDCPPGRGPRHR